MTMRRCFVGEFVGTFLLVFFGCGSVASAILTPAALGAFPVAMIWGLGIVVAIHLTASLSGAHLNPAVTIAFACWRGFSRALVPVYLAAQMLGAFAAAAALHGLFHQALLRYESLHHLVRGQTGSEATAMIFGEFFPNPGGIPLPVAETLPLVSSVQAFGAEVIGTAILLLVICGLSDRRRRSYSLTVVACGVGFTVTLLICLLGPLTMACFNPARDLAPRVYSALAGWGAVPFSTNGWGWLTVYVLAPVIGAWLGAGFYFRVLAPLPVDSEAAKLSDEPT